MNRGSWRKRIGRVVGPEVNKLAGSLVKIKSQYHGKIAQRHHVVKRRRSYHTKISMSIKQQEDEILLKYEKEVAVLQAWNEELVQTNGMYEKELLKLQALNEELVQTNELLNDRLRYSQDEAEVLRFLHTTNATNDDNAIGPLCPELVEVPGKRVGDYKLDGLLGRGAFAQVSMGRPFKPGSPNQEVAIKVFDKSKIQSTNMIARLKLECAILHHHGNIHPNIIGFYDILHARENIYLVMEKAEGSLVSCAGHTHNRPSQLQIQPDFTQQIMLGVLRALAYLHERGISHGDIDPQNILIQRSGSCAPLKNHDRNYIGAGCVKLSDFGLSHVATDNQKDDLEDYQTGKPNFLAPELAQRQKQGTRRRDYIKADMFSLGATGLWCLTGAATRTQRGLWDRWSQCYQTRLSDPKTFQISIARLVEEMRKFGDPKVLGSESELEFDFLVNGLLQMDVDCRLSSASALSHPWFQHQIISK